MNKLVRQYVEDMEAHLDFRGPNFYVGGEILRKVFRKQYFVPLVNSDVRDKYLSAHPNQSERCVRAEQLYNDPSCYFTDKHSWRYLPLLVRAGLITEDEMKRRCAAYRDMGRKLEAVYGLEMRCLIEEEVKKRFEELTKVEALHRINRRMEEYGISTDVRRKRNEVRQQSHSNY